MVEILPLGGTQAVQALRRRAVDAVWVVASPQASVVRTLLQAEEAVLMPFERAEAYTRVHRFLARVTLPEGAIDLAANVPPHDVPLLAPVATLVVRNDFHPALISLLIQAAEAGSTAHVSLLPLPRSPEEGISGTLSHPHRRLLGPRSTRCLHRCIGIRCPVVLPHTSDLRAGQTL